MPAWVWREVRFCFLSLILDQHELSDRPDLALLMHMAKPEWSVRTHH